MTVWLRRLIWTDRSHVVGPPPTAVAARGLTADFTEGSVYTNLGNWGARLGGTYSCRTT
jgi:hypothetical protein